jgi:hypothetical protein
MFCRPCRCRYFAELGSSTGWPVPQLRHALYARFDVARYRMSDFPDATIELTATPSPTYSTAPGKS